jgi:hypothetical protein
VDFGRSLEESRDDLQSLGYDTPVTPISSDSYTTLLDATQQTFSDVRGQGRHRRHSGHTTQLPAHWTPRNNSAHAPQCRCPPAAAQSAAERDRAAATALTAEFERYRAEVLAEREDLRRTHAEQLAQAQRSADQPAQALSEALSVATAADRITRGRS